MASKEPIGEGGLDSPKPTLPAPVLDEHSGVRRPGEYTRPSVPDVLLSRELYKSSAFRLGLAISAIYLVCVSIAFGLSYQFLHSGVVDRVDRSIETHYRRVLAVHNDLGDEAVRVMMANTGLPMEDNLGFNLRDPGGDTIMSTIDVEPMELGWWTEKDKVEGFRSDGSVRFLVVPLGENKLTIARSLERADRLREDATRWFVNLFFISMFLGLLGSAIAAWRMHGRIDRITEVMRSVANGSLDKRLPVTPTGDDINEFSIRVNDALDRLQQNVEGLRTMSSDMAHELKTPLNRLHIHLEGAATKLYEQGSDIEEVDKAVEEAEYINTIFQTILYIAQIEAGARKASFKPVNLMDVLGSIAEAYQPVIEESGNTLELLYDPTDVQYVMGDKDLLMQLLVNLIENSVRHCPAGSTITLNADEYHGEPWFSVADNGPGIPLEFREKVFERMYRLEESRTSKGAGLGMTFIKAVADLHSADIVTCDNGPGLSVTIRFVDHYARSTEKKP